MRLLADTCTFLWAATDAPELSRRAKQLFRDPENEVYLSAASVWEISVKYGLGRLPLPEPPELYIPSRRAQYGLLPLPLDDEAALVAARLPRLHADPFDRMLVCQAIVHGLTILTPDESIARYAVPVIW